MTVSALTRLSDICSGFSVGAEHTFIAGLNGSGKTVLLRYLLTNYDCVSVYDAKGMLDWEGYKRYEKLQDVIESKHLRVIYAPNRNELKDKTFHEAFFAWNYERARRTNKDKAQNNRVRFACAVDEAFAVVDGQDMPDSYWDILTRGRELAISILTNTQRPKWIPNTCISEAKNTYVFFLRMKTDKEKISETIPLTKEQIDELPRYSFYYYREGERNAEGPFKLHLPAS